MNSNPIDSITEPILSGEPSIGSIYKALKSVKANVDGEEDDMRKKVSNAEVSQIMVLQDINRNLDKLNRNMDWLMASVIASCASDIPKAVSETNDLAHNHWLSDSGPRHTR